MAQTEGRHLAPRAFRQPGKTALRFDPDGWSRRSLYFDPPNYERSASEFAGRRCDLRSDRRDAPRSAPFLRIQRPDSRRSLRETPSLRCASNGERSERGRVRISLGSSASLRFARWSAFVFSTTWLRVQVTQRRRPMARQASDLVEAAKPFQRDATHCSSALPSHLTV